MKKSFFLLLFACLASVVVGQNTPLHPPSAVHADLDNYVLFSVPDKSATYNYIFDGSLNLDAFEKSVQTRYKIYELAAEFAISGDEDSEGICMYIIGKMPDPDFDSWFAGTLPIILSVSAVLPEQGATKEEERQAEKILRLKSRLFD